MTATTDCSEPSGQALPAGTRLEEFVIERVLGSGGFGITYLARDTSLGRQVVIKENLPVQFCFRDPASLTVAPRHTQGDDAENFRWSLENFSKEAALLASVDHPGIVKVLRSFEALGTAYFVMPFVEGVALDELIASNREKGREFSEEELGRLLERTLDALTHLHDRGIYHRDLKPGNILITKDGVPVLIDFGSARQRLSERSMTVIESPGYTPFEQLQSRGNVGPWSDLYALGGTLCKLLTGEAPPKAMDRMRRDPFVPLAARGELAGRFSAGFLGGIDKSLMVEESDRWQDAGEWQAGLLQDFAEPPVVRESLPDRSAPSRQPESAAAPTFALPPPPQGVAVANEKTNRVGWIIGGCLVLCLVVWGMISSDQTGADERQARQAEASRAEEQQERERTAAAQAQAAATQQAEEDDRLRIERQAAAAQAEQQRLATLAKEKEEAAQAAARTAETARHAKAGNRPGEERDFEIAPGVRMVMCWIPAGEFVMGSPANELGRSYDETQHQVKLTKGFWLGKFEVTQAQWQAVMGRNPSYFKGTNLPVETVSWNDISGSGGFLEKANRVATTTGRFHLPTEAQWEYACRAGTTTALNSGKNLRSTTGACPNLDEVAWYGQYSGGKTLPVGGKVANAWGLHDMHGNVWEWCADLYGDYPSATSTNPAGSDAGWNRVARGGGWADDADNCRVANRNDYNPTSANERIGFRPARSSAP